MNRQLPSYMGICLLLMLPAFHALAGEGSATDKHGGKHGSPAGVVVEINGYWTLDGHEIELGQSVPAGGHIRAGEHHRPDWRIAVAMFTGDVFVAACEAAGACTGSFELPHVPKPPPFTQRLMSALKNLFQHGHHYEETITRSEDNGGVIFEMLVLGNRRTLDVRPLSKRTAATVMYRISNARTERPIEFDCDPETETARLMNDAATGLYELQRRTAGSSWEPAGAVLVVERDTFDSEIADFNAVKSLESSWRGSLDGKTPVRALSAAYLSELAKELAVATADG